MKKRWVLLSIILCTVSLITFILFSFTSLSAQAYDGMSEIDEINEQLLYNETNTYNISNDCFDESGFISTYEPSLISSGKFRYKLKYDLSQKNNNFVMDYPQITVLTPGLGSDAGVWSNAYSTTKSDKFAYDSQSIIAQINDLSGANIYWNEMTATLTSTSVLTDDGVISVTKPIYDFNLYDITNKTAAYNRDTKINRITDISKHIIIVFDPQDEYGVNDNIYYQFNYALSKIIYDVKILNGGKLPKLNLIGHSRGGLTNLQYALDHPDLVESLVSIDTPYFSSTTANLFGEEFMEKKDGLTDILNPDVYYDYNKRWNDNYDTLYKDIKVSAYGTYHTLVSLAEVAFNDNSDSISTLGAAGITAALAAVNVAKLTTAKTNFSQQLILGLLSECLDTFLPSNKIVDLSEILFKEINFDVYPMFVSWYNDILVDLDSQLGLNSGNFTSGTGNYKGFYRIIRPFIGGDADYTRVAQNDVPVGHNLVTRDEKIINAIICSLTFGANEERGFLTSENTDGTISIDGYRGVYASEELIIPSTIGGKEVTEISSFAFLSFDKNGIKKISIPKKIKRIGSYAFSDFLNVNSVTFESDSDLIEICEGAFMNCEKLTTIKLPASLQSFTPTVFTGCKSLTAVNVESGSERYLSASGVVYNVDGSSVLYYPEGKSSTSFTVSDNVKEIGDMAFYRNEYLTSINLNNVIFVREEAFMNCKNLGGDNR